MTFDITCTEKQWPRIKANACMKAFDIVKDFLPQNCKHFQLESNAVAIAGFPL